MIFVYLSIPVVVILSIIGLPVAYTMALVGIINIIIVSSFGTSLSIAGLTAYSSVASYTMSIIPLFLFMGNLIFTTRFGEDAYTVLKRFVSRMPGGLAQATTLACAIYGAVTGHTMAAAASISKIAMPEMRKVGYHDQLSAASIASAGTLAELIPPSIGLVFYAIATSLPPGKMLLAGYLPGILTTIVYMVTIIILVKRNPSLAPKLEKSPLKAALKELGKIWGIVLIIVGILVSLYTGIITPTEVGAMGCLFTIIIGFIYRRLSFKQIFTCIMDTTKQCGSMLFILVGAILFSTSLNLAGLPRILGTWVASLEISKFFMVTIMIVILLILGCFMSPTPIIFIMAPIYLPILKTLGIDPLFFGVIFIICLEIGAITPPYGVTLFALQATVPDLKYSHLIKGVIPFIIADLVVIVLLFIFPGVVTFLPGV